MISERSYWILLIVLFAGFSLLVMFILIPYGVVEYNLGVNLFTSSVFMVLTIFFLTWMINLQEKKRSKFFQATVQSRIADHINVLSTWVQILALEKDKKLSGLVKNDIKERRQQLSQLSQIGESVLELQLKNELVELDRRIDVLLNMYEVVVHAPSNIDEWRKIVDETLSQLIVVAKSIGQVGVVIGCEAWLEVFRSESHKAV
ncbi:hypothetical protein MUP77_06175 [Candidatus Bathyarchaeota archaeon]|nr:hypothetical protein [Candidatus Bathyarchaeota archaeon]